MIANMNESTQCAVDEAKRETAKELLESMGVILEELNNEVRMISDAVYRGGNRKTVEEVLKEPEEMPSIIAIMKGQRDTAGEILNSIRKIREILW